MEKRTELKIKTETQTFFEAVLTKKTSHYKEVLTKESLSDLNRAIEVYTKDGTWEITRAEMVERQIPKLGVE